MITAVPITNDRIASHFTKADSFVFINDQGRVVCHHINPAREPGCAGKKNLLTLLSRQNAQRIVTRNIGERMLGKLLDLDINVFKIDTSRLEALTLASEAAPSLTPLTDPAQGRKSANYETKKMSGGCGCNHDDQGESAPPCHQPDGKKCCGKH